MGSYQTYSIPGKTAAWVPKFAVEGLPSAELQPRKDLPVKDLPLGRTLWWWCKKQFFAQLCKSATEGSNKMKAWNDEVNWHCPKEQSLMANGIQGWRKNPGRNLNEGPLGERQWCYPLTAVVVDMYRAAWYPKSFCAIDANLKEVDRQWITEDLIFYFIMSFRAVQFDNITSKFDSVASFCYRFAQLGTNYSLHKELPTSGLPIS